MRAALRCRDTSQLFERLRASAGPLDFSLNDLFQNQVIERLLRDELLELCVLLLKFSETPRFACSNLAVLFPPSIVRRHSHAKAPRDLLHTAALAESMIRLAELHNNLFGAMLFLLHYRLHPGLS